MAIELNTPLNKTRAEQIIYDDTFSDLNINPENIQEAIEKIDARVDMAEAAIDQLKEGVNPTAIEELLDVNLIDLEENDILQYDGINWSNASLSDVAGASQLNELNDVSLTTVNINQVLSFNGTNWTNSTLTPPPTNLNALTDVTITSANLGQVLQYNGSEWINALVSLSLNQLNNTNIVTPSINQVLSYNGTTWVNKTLSNPTYIFNDLTDVTLTSPVNNNVVVYDNASSSWVNKTLNQIGVSEIGHNHDTNSIVSGVFSNARISESSVTQHQNALTITENQITDLQDYLTNINSESINSLNDVNISTPSTGQILSYDGTNWISSNLPTSGATTLDELTDVNNAVNPATGSVLYYNGTAWYTATIPTLTVNQSPLESLSNVQNAPNGTQGDFLIYKSGEWKFAKPILTDISNVTGTPTNGQVLSFNGTNWIPTTPSAAGSSSLDDLTDTIITSPSNNNYLKYNGTNWVNSDLPFIPSNLNDLTDAAITNVANKNILIYDSGTSQWINNSFATAGIAPATHTHSTADITSGTFDDARISSSNVTQHQSSIIITKSQVSDFGTYLTSSSNLNNLANVDTTVPSNGQVLTYATATNKWTPQTPSGSSSVFSGANLIGASNAATASSASGSTLLTWAAGSYDTNTYRDTVTNTKINLPTAGLYSISGRVGSTASIATTSQWQIHLVNFTSGAVLTTLGSQTGHAAAGTNNLVYFNQQFYTNASLVINIRLQCYHSAATVATTNASTTYIYITKLKDGVI